MKFRLNAAFINAIISTAALGVLTIFVRWLWYPGAFWEIQAVGELAAVIALVHLVGGPIVTFAISKADKPQLKMDWLIVGVLQLVALIFSSWYLFDNRPYYMVFAVDRYSVVRQGEAVFPDSIDPEPYKKPWSGPAFALAKVPEDEGEYQELLKDTLMRGGADIDRRPEFWRPYQDNLPVITSRLNTVEKLILDRPGVGEELINRLDRETLTTRDLVYAPVIGKRDDFILIVDKQSGLILTALPINPWE